jgi:hypothetical protein
VSVYTDTESAEQAQDYLADLNPDSTVVRGDLWTTSGPAEYGPEIAAAMEGWTP